MKKFSFTLQPLLKIKRLEKKQKQAEFSEACAELDRLVRKKQFMEEEFDNSCAELGNALRMTINAVQIAWYNNYSEYLRNGILQMEPAIKAAQAKKDRIQEELAGLTRETDTLEKLEKGQYRAYLEESAKEEEKTLNDVMSFRCAAQGSEAPGESV